MVDVRMPSVMVQAKRESLGLTHEALANLLIVNPRTVRAWESGRDRVPVPRREAIEAIEDLTDEIVANLVDELNGDHQAYLVVVRSDEEFAQVRPEEAAAGYTARWWRQLANRVAREVPGLDLVSPEELEQILDEAAEASFQEQQGSGSRP